MSNRVYLRTDRVVVLDDGKIVVKGSSDEFLFNADEQVGLYHLINDVCEEYMELTEDKFDRIKENELFNKIEINRRVKMRLQDYFDDGNDFANLVCYQEVLYD